MQSNIEDVFVQRSRKKSEEKEEGLEEKQRKLSKRKTRKEWEKEKIGVRTSMMLSLAKKKTTVHQTSRL